MRWWLAILGVTLALDAGCGDGVIRRVDDPLSGLPQLPEHLGFVRILCEPGDVDVYVDGEFRGRLDGYPQGVIPLPRGLRRVALRKRGHYAMYAEARIGPEPIMIETRLIPEVPDP